MLRSQLLVHRFAPPTSPPTLLRARIVVLIALTALAHFPSSADAHQSPAQPAAQTPQGITDDLSTPLPTRPDAVVGTLDNGLRYIIFKHSSPPGWATMWLHVHAGSLCETDQQRGLAHYLEHMAFNGSTNFPPGSVVPFFQSLGLTFGRDQNAFTSFDQTTYQLTTPNCEPQTLNKAMLFLSDVSHRLSLSDEEISSERKIILEERRRGLSGARRVNDEILARLAPESLVGKRITIGTQESIDALRRQDFVDFYTRWYVPANMTLIVLADTEPASIIEHIKSAFGDAKAGPRPERPDAGTRPTRGPHAVVATDFELTETTVALTRVLPVRAPATTRGAWRDELVERLALQAFNLRVQAKTKLGELPFLRVQARAGTIGNALRQVEIQAACKPDQWKGVLTALTTEVQRAHLHGLRSREIQDVKAQALATAERSAATELNRPGPLAIRAINDAVASGEPVFSAAQELELGKSLLPTISDEEVSRRLIELLDFRDVVIVLTGPRSLSEVTERELAEAGAAALGVTPLAEELRERPATLLSELPKRGEFVEATQHLESSVWSGWLANNIRVHHRFMNFRHNQASISISLAGGELLETPENRGIARAAAVAWANPATHTLDSTQIRDLVNGKNLAFVGQATSDALSLHISGTPDQMEMGLQLAYLVMTDPIIEPKSFEQWKTRQAMAIEQRHKSAAGVFSAALPDAVYPRGEARPRPLTEAQLDALTPAAAHAFLLHAIATSPIEISIVGDIEKDAAFDLIAQYLGGLPSRARISPDTLAQRRTLPPPHGAKNADVTVESSTPKAQVIAGFFGPDVTEHHDVLAMDMAARILTTRMTAEIREKRQLVYSIRPRSTPGDVFPGYGMFFTAVPTDPDVASQLADAVDAMYKEFAGSGPTEEEIKVARGQVQTDVSRDLLEPAFWSQRLQHLTYRGVTLDQLMDTPAAMQRLSADEIRGTFAKYFTDEKMIRVIVRPTSTPTAPPEAQPPGER